MPSVYRLAGTMTTCLPFSKVEMRLPYTLWQPPKNILAKIPINQNNKFENINDMDSNKL
jgi:hypothetical protein